MGHKLRQLTDYVKVKHICKVCNLRRVNSATMYVVPYNAECWIADILFFADFVFSDKVEKILKGRLDSIPSVKIQIMVGKVC